MFKKITILTACLLVFASVSSAESNELRQQRKRLENIQKNVDIIMEHAKARNAGVAMSVLGDVNAQIDNLKSRIEKRSNNILEDAFLGEDSAYCYFTDDDIKKEMKMYIKNGKVAVEETIDGEYARMLLSPEDNVIYVWDKYAEDVIKFPLGIEEERVEGFFYTKRELDQLKEDLYDCSYSDVDKDLFEKPEESVKWGDLLFSSDAHSDAMIKSSLGQLRSIIQVQHAYDLDYSGLSEIDNPENQYYQDYLSIKNDIEKSGGELTIKFSKDFGADDDYSHYCAYSSLIKNPGKVFCIDSELRIKEGDMNKINCVTGVAPNCKIK